MKLIHKLGIDWCNEREKMGFTIDHDSAMPAFIAGFKAAREMAAQQWDNVANEPVFGPMALGDVTREIAKKNAERLRNMGEEEV